MSIETAYADLNRSICEERYDNEGPRDDAYGDAFVRFTIPNIAAQTIHSAVVKLKTAGVAGPPNSEFSVYADVTGSWTESSDYSVMEALSFNSALLTGQNALVDETWYSYDILGDSGKGVAKAAAETAEGSDVVLTVRLEWTNPYAGALNIDDENNGIYVGRDYVSSSYRLMFHDRWDPDVPYVEIDYTGCSSLPMFARVV